MTVGVGIECTDGIVLGCDSLAKFGRGVPIQRYTNKIEVLDLDGLHSEIAIASAGSTTFFNKFKNKLRRKDVIDQARKDIQRPDLDIVHFTDDVCEAVATTLYKEYTIDRSQFLGTSNDYFDLSMIVAGSTYDGELVSYFVHPSGLSEPLERYGSIGSGAAYAELFIRFLISGEHEIDTTQAGQLATYAIKGVELMDPNVGGDTSIKILSQDDSGHIQIDPFPENEKPPDAKERMKDVLTEIGDELETLVEDPDNTE
jgi:20S proteasome alpha/beta subunit